MTRSAPLLLLVIAALMALLYSQQPPQRTELETAVIAWERANEAVENHGGAGHEWTRLLAKQLSAEAELRKKAKALMGARK